MRRAGPGVTAAPVVEPARRAWRIEPARTLLVRSTVVAGAAAVTLGVVAPWYAPLPLLAPAFVTWFFRDPDRTSPGGPGLVLAPADGKLDDLRREPECPFFAGPAWRIGIYLSLFGVHVNRAPVAGRLERSEHRAGRRVPTVRRGTTDRNEQRVTWFDAGGVPVVVRQLAGPITRGLVCTLEAGAAVTAGQRFGLIALGSRTELWLPDDDTVRVAATAGSRVVGGVSVLATVRVAGSARAAD